MKKFMKNKKGFTLAELLIVVAIIAVLVGIAIPVFTSKLESSREATDLANLRTAYAMCETALLTGTTDAASGKIGAVTAQSGGYYATVTLVQSDSSSWLGDNATAQIGGTTVSGFSDKPTQLKVNVDKDGKCTITK